MEKWENNFIEPIKDDTGAPFCHDVIVNNMYVGCN